MTPAFARSFEIPLAQSKLFTLFVQSWTEATPRGSTSKHRVNRCRDIPHFQLKFRDSCTRSTAAAGGGSGQARRDFELAEDSSAHSCAEKELDLYVWSNNK